MARINLTPAQPKHTQFIYDLYSREQILRGHGLHKPFPGPFWKAVIEGMIPGWESCFLITQGAAFLGHIGLQDFSREDRRAEIGIAVLPEMQNKGLGSGALRCLIDLAKKPLAEGGLGIECLVASVIEDNVPSSKLFKKFRFFHNGTIPNFYRFGSKRLAKYQYVRLFV